MVTAIDICNLALSNIGDTAEVTSIAPPDGSVAASLCARFYPMARESVLEMYPWSWAGKRATLDLVTFTDPELTSDKEEWLFCYELPEDLLVVREVIAVSGVPMIQGDVQQVIPAKPYDYSLGISTDGTGEVRLYTNVEDAILSYTYYVTNPQFFPPLVVDALSWKLASMLAGPIIHGNEGRDAQQYAMRAMMTTLGMAKVSDALQARTTTTHTPDWMAGR